MSKTNVPIVKIDTDPAKKSLKDLRKALKDFKDEMANLEEGSDEFLEIANKAGEVKHQIDEINESVKGASSDFGDVIGNITNVAAGITGAFQAVAGGLQAFGVESEAIDQAIAKMQGLMAVTQGLSQIDTAIKSWDKLEKVIGTNAYNAVLKFTKGFGKIGLIVAAVTALGVAFVKLKERIDGTSTALKERESAQKNFNTELERELEIRKRAGYEEEELINFEISKIELRNRELKATNKELQEQNDLVSRNAQAAQTAAGMYGSAAASAAYSGVAQSSNINVGANTQLIRENTNEIEENDKKLKELQKTLLIISEARELATQRTKENTSVITENISATRDGRIETSNTPILEIKPIVAPLTEDDKNKIKGIIDAALETAKEERLKKLQEQEDLGVEFFEGLKNSFSDYSDSSLGITSGWIESLNVFEEAFLQTMNTVKENGKLTWTDYTQIATSALGGVGTLLNALSQEQDASNEEGFKKMKQLQIAATTINMLAGITAALSGLFTTKTGPWDIALASIQAATIAATGAAQIAKIKNTSLDRANPYTNINAKSTAGMIMPPTQYSQAVIGSSIDGKIKDTKVYVTETDITNTINKVSVQERENQY